MEISDPNIRKTCWIRSPNFFPGKLCYNCSICQLGYFSQKLENNVEIEDAETLDIFLNNIFAYENSKV